MAVPYYTKFETDAKVESQITDSTIIGGVTTTSTIPSTGNIHAIGVGAGTYANWGGMVVPTNNIGTLQRINGVYSVSLAPISGVVTLSSDLNSTSTTVGLNLAGAKVLNDKIVSLESDLYQEEITNTSFGRDVTTGQIVTDSPWVELIPATVNGILTNFKLPSFTGVSVPGNIFVISSNNVIKSKTAVTFTGVTTDLSSHNIVIVPTDRVGFYASSMTSVLKYTSGNGAGLASFSNSITIGSTIVPSNQTTDWSLNYYWTVQTTTLVSNKVYVADFNLLEQQVIDLATTSGVNNGLLELYKNPNTKTYSYGKTVALGSNLVPTLYCSGEVFSGRGGVLLSLTLCNPSPSNGNVQIAICTISSGNATINSIHTVSFLQGDAVINLESYNIAINKGQSIALAGNNTNIITFTGSTGSAYGFSSMNVGSVSGAVANVRINFKVDILESNLIFSDIKKLNIDNAQTLVIMGSSLSESVVVPNGFGWQERINDMCDIPVVNSALGGKDIIYNIFQVATAENLPHDALGNVKVCNPSYVMWLNSANGTLTGFAGIEQLKKAMTATLKISAKMLVGTEEFWSDGGLAHDQKITSFGVDNDIPFSALEELHTKLYPINPIYDGFNYAGHGSWRNIASYIKHYDDIIKHLPINKTIKMFRPRPTFKAGSPTISDLVYDSSNQRFEKFVSISAGNGTQNSTDTGNLDNIDNHSFAVVGGINTGIASSETSIMMRGGDLSFNKFALIEFIVDQINIPKATFSIYCDVAPTAVYVAIINDTQYTSTTVANIASSFASIPFLYVNGLVTADLSGNIFQYDKVRIIIEKTGTFKLSCPELKWFNANDKFTKDLKFIDRKFGLELLSNTDLASNWTLSGATIKSFPSPIAQYSGFNAITSHAELLAENDFVTRTITITQPCTKVALRIVAQHYHKIATTRFNADALTLASGYVANDAPQVVPYDFDYGKLVITVNNSLCYERTVMQGWHEIYLEVPISPTATFLTVDIAKSSIVDASYTNAVKPILIHNVSLQKII